MPFGEHRRVAQVALALRAAGRTQVRREAVVVLHLARRGDAKPLLYGLVGLVVGGHAAFLAKEKGPSTSSGQTPRFESKGEGSYRRVLPQTRVRMISIPLFACHCG